VKVDSFLAKDLGTWVGTFARGLPVTIVDAGTGAYQIQISRVGRKKHFEWVPKDYLRVLPS
jgi:hypothetical protein